jgi:hypothetical protein
MQKEPKAKMCVNTTTALNFGPSCCKGDPPICDKQIINLARLININLYHLPCRAASQDAFSRVFPQQSLFNNKVSPWEYPKVCAELLFICQ